MPSASFNEKKANSINGMSGRKVSVEGSIYNLRPYLGNIFRDNIYIWLYYRNIHLLMINLQKKNRKHFYWNTIQYVHCTFRQPQKLKGRKKPTKSVFFSIHNYFFVFLFFRCWQMTRPKTTRRHRYKMIKETKSRKKKKKKYDACNLLWI